MNDIHLIDSCQAHLPVQKASNIKFIHQSDTGVVIDMHINHNSALDIFGVISLGSFAMLFRVRSIT